MDAALVFDAATVSADLGLTGGDLVAEEGLKTAVLLSLFTDRRAEEDDELPAEESDRRGWWGDLVPPAPRDRIGSKLWLLTREKLTRDVQNRAREYAREALQWLIDDRVAQSVSVDQNALVVDLADGRKITVPLTWFPRLAAGTPAERANSRLIGAGEGIHWPELDEDISVQSLLAGKRSGETQESLRRWLEGRKIAG